MSRPPFRGRLKAVAADFCQLINSPSTGRDKFCPSCDELTSFLIHAARLFCASGSAHSAPRRKSLETEIIRIFLLKVICSKFGSGYAFQQSHHFTPHEVAPRD
jgi:hypothetical protein